jgi:hypothetical protein
MNTKPLALSALRQELAQWEALLAGLDQAQLTEPLRPSELSIKDQLAHLAAWQQRTLARLEAALHDRPPAFPDWPAHLDPEADDVDPVNAWIFETHREQPWDNVHAAWRRGFLRVIELVEAIPAADLFDESRYSWMDGYPLDAALEGTYEHHHVDHLEPLLEWLRAHGRSTG